MKASRGFTLLELMLVLLIMGLAAGLAAPLLGSGNDALEAKSAARQLAAGLRKARSLAVTDQAETVLTLDLARRRFSVSGDPRSYRLPAGLELSLYTAQSEQVQEQVGNIRFFPDGSSTGGRITLAAGRRKTDVDVTWLTGQVAIQSPP
jgi:general secretion pathway protein H